MINPFKILIGEQLSSVTFIQDYLQLDFDGNIITCYLWPEVLVKGEKSIYTQENYKNLLCTNIAQRVKEVNFMNESLSILFESNNSILFELKNINKEAIYFTTLSGEWSSI